MKERRLESEGIMVIQNQEVDYAMDKARIDASGFDFLQEQENGKTQRLKLMSLRSFKQAITEKPNTDNSGMKGILSPKHSEQQPEETLPLYGKTLVLRKLTPTEKERLQGFPSGWTFIPPEE